MFNFEEKKEKVKTWLAENGGLLMAVGLGVIVIGTIALIPTGKEEIVQELPVTTEPIDWGRDLIMQFVDPENGEVLNTIECTETFMNDMVECVRD